jgi:hypothetical protein
MFIPINIKKDKVFYCNLLLNHPKSSENLSIKILKNAKFREI